MANDNIGYHRKVVGAHYGLVDWLAQRVTAVLMLVYTFVLLIGFLLSGDIGYEGWAGLFAQQWFKLLTFATLMGLFYHAWVGMRNIWMDYIKPIGLRLLLQVLTIVWLVACVGWTIQILWRA
ncbi:MAG TPA: succinate dehydrogenase, hydrophobic membrane anchor protein [Oxalicibacterium sp.]|nr:succinate dehydrogenase, hydrophobic membrane anchor protein [Oxalicibacterium sp.]